MNELENPVVGIEFIQDSIVTEQRYAIIKEFMAKNSKCIVEFKKVDGTLRKMPCTLDNSLITYIPVKSLTEEVVVNYGTIAVWCLDKSAWRAFKTDNVVSINVQPDE